ncbi:Innexin shaking-B [Eufriesea mexicana]|uniref:Innexin shaking-B n=1 Tax=Eufriesea mexicana TaxID=516756 RepID=A0A310SI89_9HYME|nr:Innexin shaking-B [Eufriesea mexicana]
MRSEPVGKCPSSLRLAGGSGRFMWEDFTPSAILFYTPRWLWKGWEGGKIHALMMDLDIGLCSEVEKKQKKKMLLDYLWENLRYHNWWAYRYYLCEVLALVNVIEDEYAVQKNEFGEQILCDIRKCNITPILGAYQDGVASNGVGVFWELSAALYQK